MFLCSLLLHQHDKARDIVAGFVGSVLIGELGPGHFLYSNPAVLLRVSSAATMVSPFFVGSRRFLFENALSLSFKANRQHNRGVKTSRTSHGTRSSGLLSPEIQRSS